MFKGQICRDYPNCVISQGRRSRSAKADGKLDNLTASGGVSKDEEESDATRTDVKSKAQLQESPSAETDTEVRKSVVMHVK